MIALAPKDRIADLIAAQAEGRPLTQTFYDDPEIFQRELDRMVLKHWLCTGHVSTVPNVGDFFLVEIANESTIVVRGEDGELRAFVNVCRHRGSRVCREAAGNTRVLICPYHAWTYGIDGKLRAARHMEAPFDKGQHGLKEIPLRIIEGLIFVTFAEKPLGLSKVEEVLCSCYGPHGWADAKVAHRETYHIDANWKLAVENYVECYHCAPAHPDYARLHANEQPREKIAKLNAQMDKRAAALGLSIPNRDYWALAAPAGEEAISCARFAMRGSIVTGSADGKPVAPLMGAFKDYDGGSTFINLGPVSFFLAYPDHGIIYRFIPRSLQRSEMEVIWLVRGNAREGVDYDREKLTWLWRVTSEADKRIIEDNQKGVNSRYYTPGPLSQMEFLERRFVEWYLHEIS
jgi:Rieske 2Fe-2S family protein